jgi:hypothetical protein
MIVTINERQHIHNGYVCSFCEDDKNPVIGRAYTQHKYDHPLKQYLFSYCEKCCIKQANKMMAMV